MFITIKEIANGYGVHRSTAKKYLEMMFGKRFKPITSEMMKQFAKKYGPPSDPKLRDKIGLN